MNASKKMRILFNVVLMSLVADMSVACAADVFSLQSPNFKDGEFLAPKNGGVNASNPNCAGENISPALAWRNPPSGTKSFALLMVDPQGRAGQGVDHWVGYGIPATVTGFAEGEISKANDKVVGGRSTLGLPTYFGPCVPPGAPHHYNFTLIATDLDPRDLPPGLSRVELMEKLDGHSKDATGLVGLARHP